MNQSRYIFSAAFALLLLLLVNACQKENTRINAEAAKDIVGTWKIASVTRNGVDITDYFDFSAFRIQFKGDGSYIVGHEAPFVIAKDGTWTLDDGAYPLRISFIQQGGSQAFVNEFEYPVVEGVRRIILKGSPGCNRNTYQYALVAAE
ncbi:MAG TPA: DUF5004 domain-containing protein [Niabella sp.]|nr:DUF5004 domain-containing protein [Niabella sp.]